MKKSMVVLAAAALLVACSSNNTASSYDFKPYRYARGVWFSSSEKAFASLALERTSPFYIIYSSRGQDELGFKKDLKYDDSTVFHIQLNCWGSAESEMNESLFSGSFTVSSAPGKYFYIQTILQCGFWGAADWRDNINTTNIDGCGCEEHVFSLLYPEVDCDRDASVLPRDIVDFLRMSLFEQMVIPMQTAMDELGIYPNDSGGMACACPA